MQFLNKYLSIKSLFLFSNFLFLFAFLQSCVITGSQVKATKSFYASVKELDKQCKTIKEATSTVSYERKLLYPESYFNDSVIVNQLVDNYEIYSKEINSTDSFAVCVNTLGGYFDKFSSLLPKEKTNPQISERKVLNAIENFSSYLPFGIGLTIYQTLYDLVSYTARFMKIPHKRKQMKKFILEGKNIVDKNSEYIVMELKETSKKLENEKVSIKENYLKFLNEQKVNKTPNDYYQIYNPIFLKKYHLASTTLDLTNSLIELIPDMQKAYEALYNNLQERNRLKNDIPELSKMYTESGISSRRYVILNDALKQNKAH